VASGVLQPRDVTKGALAALALALAPAIAVAHPAARPADEVPARWTTGVALGADRSGDLRPEARAILDRAALAPATYTLGAARAAGLAPPLPAGPTTAAFEAPATIRVWRRALDGSTASCDGRVDVIPFDQYVRGVLPHEWIRSWRAESLAAGAIVIRTYAAWWVNAGGKYDCADVDDTTASQVYKDEFYPQTDAAVDATSGIYVAQAGELVFAEYSAENGDPTAFGVAEPLCTGQAVNGHRRGTCQWGSQRWAQDGKTPEWIATHYYPGSELVGVDPIRDATLGAAEYAATLTSGDEMVVWIEYTNTGNTPWDAGTTLLGTTGPRDRDSAFFKAENWVSASRPTGVDRATAPGEVGRFTWAMVAPEVDEPTTFVEQFALVTADGAWFGPPDDAVTWTITVMPREGADEEEVDPSTQAGGCSTAAAGGGTIVVACIALLAIRRRRRAATVLAVLLALLAACSLPSSQPDARPRVPVGGDSTLVDAFLRAGADARVPAELLAAVSYVETRFRFAGQYAPGAGDRDDHGAAAIGLVALTEGGPRDIARGAALAGFDEALAHTDPYANLRAGAALLRDAAPDAKTLADFRPALVAFGGGDAAGAGFAEEVYTHLARGFTGTDGFGGTLTVSARPEARPGPKDGDGFGTVIQGLGYPGSIWNPATTANYQASNRGDAQINYIVIHTVQGSYNGCISWFKNPAASVSAHYVVRSSDGEITQMVDDSDVAWHDACFNSQSIGIEHEGYVQDPATWYTEAMYLESAKLTAWLADAYSIPKDRQHIYGHGDAPDCSDHTDPGSGWDWAHYMDLVSTGGAAQFGAAEGAMDYPMAMVSGDEAVVWVEFTNQGNTTWDLDLTRLGTAEPADRVSAFYKDGNWLGPNRPTGADHSNYGPGAVGRFSFVMLAPDVEETTTFTEAFQLVQEGVSWFGPIVRMTITVHPIDDGGDDGGTDPGDDGGDDGTDPGDDSTQPPAPNAGCAATRGDGTLVVACAMLLACVRRRRRAV
jgi:hypothetical protein